MKFQTIYEILVRVIIARVGFLSQFALDANEPVLQNSEKATAKHDDERNSRVHSYYGHQTCV